MMRIKSCKHFLAMLMILKYIQHHTPTPFKKYKIELKNKQVTAFIGVSIIITIYYFSESVGNQFYSPEKKTLKIVFPIPYIL